MDGTPRSLGSLGWGSAAGKEVLQVPEFTRASVFYTKVSLKKENISEILMDVIVLF